MLAIALGCLLGIFAYPAWLMAVLLGRGTDPLVLTWLLTLSASANLLLLGGLALETRRRQRKE